jgi:hypothetical protein
MQKDLIGLTSEIGLNKKIKSVEGFKLQNQGFEEFNEKVFHIFLHINTDFLLII